MKDLILQFLPFRKPDFVSRFLSAYGHDSCVYILDLEDGPWNPFSSSQTHHLKEAVRNGVLDVVHKEPAIFSQYSIGIRVNPFFSSHWRNDLALLESVIKTVSISCLVLPKVDSAKTYLRSLNDLAGIGLSPATVIPQIENPDGLAQLQAISKIAHSMDQAWISYGHYDYCLAAQIWPFYDFRYLSYWVNITFFIRCVESSGLSVLHPPIPVLNDMNICQSYLGLIRAHCSHGIGIFSVSNFQTKNYVGLLKIRDTLPLSFPLPDIDYSKKEKTLMATAVVEGYLASRKSRLSFAVQNSECFISPHQYLAALKFLESTHDDKNTKIK